MTFKDIKEKAIRIIPGYAIKDERGRLSYVSPKILEIVTKNFEYCYGRNKDAVSFVSEGEYYVIPYTSETLRTLEDAGFQNWSIIVFIYGDVRPADPIDCEKWESLKAEAGKEQRFG